ncbi:ABC transporter substrate-binding protein [Salinarimonas rosea]|uniref:ABC transporter substrate-binding protein n=1 Tax=Salinarimonas rosea TaxID=552063 RepID=UPI0004097265|nr:ABC transporter substrate-binding protein [Salinarimonas rosea]
MIRTCILAGVALAALGAPASAFEPVRVGVLLGFTGPIETLAPAMARSADLAFEEATRSGRFLDGRAIEAARADSTCADAAAATAAAERLVSVEEVAAILGADCSGASVAVVSGITVPRGVLTVSPASTAPALSTREDRGLFFRTAPSDARQGEILAAVAREEGVEEIAITYVTNDYGKGLADSFAAAFERLGGTVLISAGHVDGAADYSAEIGALAASGAEHLAVFGYLDQGGRGVVQAALDTGAFERFVFADGMYGESLVEAIGEDLDGAVIGTVPGTSGAGAETFQAMAEEAGFDGASLFAGESYDAAALITLAIAAGGGEAGGGTLAANLMEIANAPGEPILPGELDRGLEIIAEGGAIDYEGASGVELIGPGEAAGSYRVYGVEGGEIVTLDFR